MLKTSPATLAINRAFAFNKLGWSCIRWIFWKFARTSVRPHEIMLPSGICRGVGSRQFSVQCQR